MATETPAPACTPSFDPTDPNQKEVSGILATFKLDVMGIISLGTDGVLRSLTANRTIISAEGLSPLLITTFLSRLPPEYQTGWEDADGTKTPREKWFKLDEGILPKPLAEEEIRKVLEWSEEKKRSLRKRLEEDERQVCYFSFS